MIHYATHPSQPISARDPGGPYHIHTQLCCLTARTCGPTANHLLSLAMYQGHGHDNGSYVNYPSPGLCIGQGPGDRVTEALGVGGEGAQAGPLVSIYIPMPNFFLRGF